MMQQVTILMPIYNGRTYVKEQIASILGQTHTALKLIVHDDGSTDGSYDYIQAEFGREPRVQIHRGERNIGVIAAIECLLAKVDTEVFFLADSDDVWLPTKVERTLAVLNETGADLVYTDLKMVDADLSMIHPSKWLFSNTPPVAGNDPSPIILKNPVTGCTIAARASLIAKATPFPPGVPMHDRWLAAVAACTGKIAYLPEATMLYRQHGNNEAGGLPFGIAGFRRRVGKSGRGSVQRYLRNRAQQRQAIIAGLAQLGHDHPSLAPIARMYEAPWSNRIFLAPRYLAYLAKRHRTLGGKNILAEMFMHIVPRGDDAAG